MHLTIKRFNHNKDCIMVSLSTKEELRQRVIDHFWETIPPIWNQVRNNLRCIAAEDFGISVEQFHILRHIRKGITSVSELAEVKRISRPAISQGVDGLVEKGLISRRQDADDRRFVHLMLTEDGEGLLNRIFQENRAWMMGKISILEAEEMVSVINALDVLKKTLED
jgi:DNA-binding MarR family transcriptional regulator